MNNIDPRSGKQGDYHLLTFFYRPFFYVILFYGLCWITCTSTSTSSIEAIERYVSPSNPSSHRRTVSTFCRDGEPTAVISAKGMRIVAGLFINACINHIVAVIIVTV